MNCRALDQANGHMAVVSQNGDKCRIVKLGVKSRQIHSHDPRSAELSTSLQVSFFLFLCELSSRLLITGDREQAGKVSHVTVSWVEQG